MLVQILVWIVVRRYHYADTGWLKFALTPDALPGMSLLIAPFVHLDPAHLGFNLLLLYLLGGNLERLEGPSRLLLLYLGASWFSALVQWAALLTFQAPDSSPGGIAAVGASGAIAALLGAVLVRLPHQPLRLPFSTRASVPLAPFAVAWAVYSVLRAFAGLLSTGQDASGNWAHLAGFFFGLSVAQILRFHHRGRSEFLEWTARQALQAGDHGRSALALRERLQLHPTDVSLRLALVGLLLQMGEEAPAATVASSGLTLLVQQERKQEALRLFTRCAAALPELELPPGIRYRLGCWIAERGNPREAISALMRAAVEETDQEAAAATLLRAAELARGLEAGEELCSKIRRRIAAEYGDTSAAAKSMQMPAPSHHPQVSPRSSTRTS